MAKEGSVAPKERINVTFKPSTGAAQEEIELPCAAPSLAGGTILVTGSGRRLRQIVAARPKPRSSRPSARACGAAAR